MSDLSLTILPETANDAQAIERLHERTFGPGRFVLSAYRLREHVDHLLDLSFTAWIGTLLVGSVRQLPVCVGDTKALLLGPLTVEPPFRSRGVGRALLDRALTDAKAKGHRLVLLVGDEAYYSRVGFKPVPKGRATMPGPVDYSRLLVAELVDGAFSDVSGAIRPDWSMARLSMIRKIGYPIRSRSCSIEAMPASSPAHIFLEMPRKNPRRGPNCGANTPIPVPFLIA
jgi:predicted N-acetyltransferase YhbS